MKPERLDRTVIYTSPWVNLYLDKVQFPNGRVIEQHHLLDFDRAAVTAVVTNEDGQVLLVQVTRYTTGLTEWETPAGGIETGESVIEAGQREVLEETGYETVDHCLLHSYYPMNGIANKVFHILHCRAAGLAATFDQQEIDRVRWFGWDEIRTMIAAGQMRDGFSLMALLLVIFETENCRTKEEEK